MGDTKKNKTVNESAGEPSDIDFYMFEPVPMRHRRETWKQVLVWVGFGYVATGLFVGGQLAGVNNGPGMPFPQAALAIAIGMAILLVMATMLGIMAQKTGMSLALLSRYSFGRIGANIPLLIMGTLVLGWFSAITGMVGDIWGQFFAGLGFKSTTVVFDPAWIGRDVQPVTLGIFIICIVCGLLFTYTAMFGIKGLEVIAVPVSPIIMLIAVTAGIAFLNKQNGFGNFVSNSASLTGLALPTAITMVVGSWICGAITGVDLFRFNKNIKAVFLGAFACFILTNPLLNVVGYLGTVTVGKPNYIEWMMGLSVVFAAIGAITWMLSLWTTNDAELYFNALYYGPVLSSAGFNVPRKTIVLVAGIIATFIGAIGFYQMFFANFINFLGTVTPPVAGPLLADFFIVRRMKYDLFAYNSQPRFNMVGIISTVIGMAVGFYGEISGIAKHIPMGVVALLVTILLYAILHKIMIKK